ncbi:hypothetical protein PV05_03328 [Exophiala xenobiotica]|uniref:Uncharacterized protein n=1 Tax=Exophiala xenobiotica TaxID=348802 RepID=A0A0D2FFD8_9EURO|nr:uncharacterized protein PV05_03328 [Exophiala xenobiotica]KIW58834.1 hypothetical protein PV05_03328 [Exophiala xenobiotica]
MWIPLDCREAVNTLVNACIRYSNLDLKVVHSDSSIREMGEKINGWMKDSAQKKAVLVDLGGIPINLEVKKPLTMAEAMDLHMKRTQAEVAAQAVAVEDDLLEDAPMGDDPGEAIDSGAEETPEV